MNKNEKIFVAGHRGLVGSAIVRRLLKDGFDNFILRTSKELDLKNQNDVRLFFENEKPDYVFMAAAKVGGIWANETYPAQFIYENIAIQTNVIHSAYEAGVKKLLFLGSSCIYPKFADQPMTESALLTGSLKPTNQWYAVAKISGVRMCQAYRRQYGFNAIALMPTNLYGPGDNFDLQNSHVLPALLRKFHEAKISGSNLVEVWGSGKPRREFLHVDDLADACLFLMHNYDGEEIINVGVGMDIAIADLAELIKKVTGFKGQIVFDASKPDGTPRKLLDISKLTGTGWKANIDLRKGVNQTYRWYIQQNAN